MDRSLGGCKWNDSCRYYHQENLKSKADDNIKENKDKSADAEEGLNEQKKTSFKVTELESALNVK